MNEAECATVKFTLQLSKPQNARVEAYEHTVELLPRNQWGGLSHLPEMVAAFVQPNDPAVERLLKQAALFLRESGKNPALNGYGSGPKHAWEILSAIWSALVAERLDYALPPASFEQLGQKVRSPTQILDLGLATCLDLSLLFASAAEQAGLNPLLVFTEGHAFVGCWLRPEEFAVTVIDDPTALRKRLRLGELILFETTVLTNEPPAPFTRAIELGAGQVAEDSDSPFESVIDIRRARMHRVLPLAVAESDLPLKPSSTATDVRGVTLEEAPDLLQDVLEVSLEPDLQTLMPADRIARWQRKLLDLSLRNNLLNFRKGKRSVVLDAPDPGKLEDALAEGQALRLLSRPSLMDGPDPRSREIHEGRSHTDLRKQHALEGLSKREVYIGIDPDQLESTLVELYRASRTSLEEGGANTLFLVLGFLVWTQEGKSQKYRAPLILIPVTLSRRSVRSGFTLSLHEDEPQFNPTLVQMLKQDFQLTLSFAEGELPRDESGLDVASIWARVSHAVKDIKDWEVVSDVVLSTLSFAKYLMWKDLVDRTDQLRENPVVRHLIDSPRDYYRSDASFSDPAKLDLEYHPRETFCPLPADSSQLAAIMSAARGKDFVLIGPPGTGKSQTITNLIAHCLATGKRVLFVAEKIAALEVVHRRLRDIGIGEFCLELHSSKAKKASVLAALGTAWSVQSGADAHAWEREAQRLKKLRDNLNQYVHSLHTMYPNGLSVHRALGIVIGGAAIPTVQFAWPDPSTHDGSFMESLRETVEQLESQISALGVAALKCSPLLPVRYTQWAPRWQTEFLIVMNQVQVAAARTQEVYRDLSALAGLPVCTLTNSERRILCDLGEVLPLYFERRWIFLTETDLPRTAADLRTALSLLTAHHSEKSKLNEPWPSQVRAACCHGLNLLQELDILRRALPAPWPQSITDEIRRGIQLLQKIAEQERHLSVRYDFTRTTPNFAALSQQWDRAQQSVWPWSWWLKRKVRSTVLLTITGTEEPQLANDLPILQRLEIMRQDVDGIDLRMLPTEVWCGQRTSVAVASAALNLQQALAQAHDGQPWNPVGLELVESGFCGTDLKQLLASLMSWRRIQDEIRQLEWLTVATGNLWSGETTNTSLLMAAVDFCEDWQCARLQKNHDLIARGGCGTFLQGQYETLREMFRLEAQINGLSGLDSRTNGLWQGLNSNLEDLDRALASAEVFGRAIPSLAPDSGASAAVRRALANRCVTGVSTSQVRELIAKFTAGTTDLVVTVELLANLGCFVESQRREFEALGLAELEQRLARIASSASGLSLWSAWCRTRDAALRLGLEALIVAMEEGRITAGSVAKTFETNYSRWWLNIVVSEDAVLRKFAAHEHESRIISFRSVDDRYTKLTKELIRAHLCANSAGPNRLNPGPEWGLLQRELSKKKRQIPLRELMQRIPGVVTSLTPCLLMSPLSIAQYLTVSAAAFDVVIFDEASQITVWDAIGAIARARQVVMVGDPKQLPPTNFFNKVDTEDDSDDVPEDLESILDECLGANLPQISLNWHYRSRHEDLIAFSNHRYYSGRLVTFPAPVTNDRAVNFHYVGGGVYERGGARVNQTEAKSVVTDIVTKLRSPAFAQSGATIGVVTLNAEQQKLIEDLLDEERRNDPSIDSFFVDSTIEPIFVKNLESVQGDERDIIYLSITYGPDRAGRRSLNFGPMNREGGERRLNVAITRARKELLVFSSLRAEEIELSRTQAVGVSELKYFLEYAERGARAFADSTPGSLGEFDSPFEQCVAASLQTRGWVIHTQVGASTFRIDLGVVHPDAPGVYLAGVECDGATYHRSATARDRDKLRQQVLEALGWNILRVWSTDWWIDSETALNRLDADLHRLFQKNRRTAAQAVGQADAQTQFPSVSTRMRSSQVVADHPRAQLDLTVETGPATFASAGMVRDTLPDLPTNEERQIHLFGDHPSPAAELFFEKSYDVTLSKMIVDIVDREGPILDEVLARRIARAHGLQRTGPRITERVKHLAARTRKKSKEGTVVFFWPSHLTPGQEIQFRPGANRTVEEVCIQELIALAKNVLTSGSTGEDVIAAMARSLGVQRLRAANRSRLESALRRARRNL